VDSQDPASPERKISLFDLFSGFLMIGLQGFGGIANSSHYIIVEKRKWLTAKEFVELFGVCSILPGGNFLNASIMLGARSHGPLGSITAISALLLMPLVILIMIAVTYDQFQHVPEVRAATAGAASAAAGLIIATALKLTKGVKWTLVPIAMAVGTFILIGYLRAPLWMVVVIFVPLSIGLTALARRRA
jgi:chromate transporter